MTFTVTYARAPDGTWRFSVDGYDVRADGVPGEDLNERVFEAVRTLAPRAANISVRFVPEEAWAAALRGNNVTVD
jgi:hypothetical protein